MYECTVTHLIPSVAVAHTPEHICLCITHAPMSLPYCLYHVCRSALDRYPDSESCYTTQIVERQT